MFIYDFEVFKHDWLVVFKNYETKEYFVFHNANHLVADFIEIHKDELFTGFNIKHYDIHILKGVILGLSPEQLKEISDYIIEEEQQGWTHPYLEDNYFKIYQCDLKDDTQQGVSLKSFEAHMGMDIEESEVSFATNNFLTTDELSKVIYYCKYDVDAAEELYEIRKRYVETKIKIGKRANIQPNVAVGYTNAKLDAVYLGAKFIDWGDSREYNFPNNLDTNILPVELKKFFLQINDLSISDKDLFEQEFFLKIVSCTCKYKWGGGHGSLQQYKFESTSKRICQNRDVISLYPSLMIIYNYLSRNVSNPQIFLDTKNERVAAKQIGDKETASTLKLPINVTSGAQGQPSNDLYDPKQTIGMRISGQLFLTDLILHIVENCPSFALTNFNTDGFAYEIDIEELPIIDNECKKWEQRTSLTLETDNIKKIFIKDVNSLLFIDENDNIKTVGSYLNYGISDKGGWNINNNYVIVKKAIINFLAKDIPVEETINNCNDILQFQLIAKIGRKFSRIFHLVDGQEKTIQKVNRVYATKHSNFGSVYKVHAVTNTIHHISEMPEHSIIDNKNQLNITDIDKEWYIKLTKKKINDYLGVSTPIVNKRKVNSLIKKIKKILEEK